MDAAAGLDEMARRADFVEVCRWLRSATPQELAEARAWYVKGRARMRRWYGWRSGEVGASVDGLSWRLLPWIEAVFAVRLAGPVSAAGWVPWRSLATYYEGHGAPAVLEFARDRGQEWCADFVPAVAAVRMGERDLQVHSSVVYATLRELIETFGLPVPVGAAFAVGWTQSFDRQLKPDELLGRIVGDPLAPDVLCELLWSGYVSQLPSAAEAALALITKGGIDRERFLRQCFELLTTVPSVGTQRFIAAVFAGLPIVAAEMPGELSLLQGIIATCHGSVGALFLPFAIDALATEDDLVELSTTIAGRSERRQKDMLIKALGSDRLRDRLGLTSLTAALDIFGQAAAGDAQLDAKLDRVANRLGVDAAAPAVPQVGERLGLWELTISARPFESPRLEQVPDSAELRDNLIALVNPEHSRRARPPGLTADVWSEIQLAAVVRLAAATSVDGVRELVAGLSWPDVDSERNHVRYDPILEALYDGMVSSTAPSLTQSVDLVGAMRIDVRTRCRARPHSLVNRAPRQSPSRVSRGIDHALSPRA